MNRINALMALCATGLGMWAMTTTGAGAKSLPTDPTTIKKGAAVYAQNCAACHGIKAQGEGPGPKAFSPKPIDFTKDAYRHGGTDEQIVKSITFGVPGTSMTAWKGRISENDITAVAAYLRSLKK